LKPIIFPMERGPAEGGSSEGPIKNEPWMGELPAKCWPPQHEEICVCKAIEELRFCKREPRPRTCPNLSNGSVVLKGTLKDEEKK